jgi:NAD(P)-dependent dehydrogenase (short-subunit alcohol dehydrogenase family)
MVRLKDRIAIVTGAARGNGEGIARALAKEGATVVLWDVVDRVDETAKSIRSSGHNAVSFKVDITETKQVNQTVQEILKKYAKIDVLVNNAGVYPFVPFLEMSDELRDKVFNINIKGTWNCTQAVLPSMINQKYGKIVNISSVTGPLVSDPGATAYSATKGAISGFTRALALEVAEFGINVNAILPGYINTPGVRELVTSLGEDPDEFVKKLANSVPMKRLGTIDEVGDLAVFLASEESKYITGQEIVVDGGNVVQEQKA